MYKILPLIMLLVFFSACYSKRHNAGIYSYDISEQNIIESREILLTSLFVATSHVPEGVKIYIGGFDKEKSYLSKEARKKISDFAADTLIYEDYSIIIEGHADISEINPDELSEKRADAVKKALIKSGLDKDRIESIGVGASRPAAEGVTEKEKRKNRRAVIEAELW
ncbi:MAG: OmpA family protein [Endomicrobia bacterium]|nr:OmpA family protein [Endomicrobiia bacterium]